MTASSPNGAAVNKGGRSLVPWVALGVLMALAAAYILYMGRGLTFFRDEWIFVIYRDGHDPTNFLSSHAGHLLLWPIALFVFLFRAVGLDHYELYRLVALPLHLACALLVYLLARRRVGDVVALAPATILLFLGSSWMDILWPFQVSFTGAIAFGLAALLLLDRDDLRGDALACACLLISLGWSGASLPFLAGVAVGLLVRRRFLRRVWVVAVPAVAYLAWQAKYGDQQTDYASLSQVPEYALRMAGAGITGITGLPLELGPYLAALLGALVLVRLWQLGRESPLAWESLAMALAFWGLTAVARADGNDPGAARYIYPSAVFLLLLAVGLAPARAPRRWIAIAVLALTALTLPSNIAGFQEGRDDMRFTAEIASAELGALELARSSVAPEYSPELNEFWGVPSAAFFGATGRYGSSPADTPAEIANSAEYARHRADGTSVDALHIRFRALERRPRLAGDAPLLAVRSGRVEATGGCVSLGGAQPEAAGILPPEGLIFSSPRSTPVQVELRRFAHRFGQAIPELSPGGVAILRPASDGEKQRRWRFRLRADRGTVSVCSPLARIVSPRDD